MNEFALLPKEHLDFLRLFVKTRGNLKEVERILGVSYPTVRARLDALLKALGYEEDEGKDRLEVLEALRRGEISVEEALKYVVSAGFLLPEKPQGPLTSLPQRAERPS